jgi:hypothetical protein
LTFENNKYSIPIRYPREFSLDIPIPAHTHTHTYTDTDTHTQTQREGERGEREREGRGRERGEGEREREREHALGSISAKGSLLEFLNEQKIIFLKILLTSASS